MVSLNYTSIQKSNKFQVVDIQYEYTYVSLSSSKREGEDNASDFDRFESNLTKADESKYLQVKFNYEYTMKTIESEYGPFDPEEIEFYDKFISPGLIERLTHVANSDFGRISYTDAIKELEKHNDKFEFKVSWGVDLQTEHERYLCETIFKKPVFVTDYPKDIKAFYMKQNPDGKTVAASDLLVPGIGEIIGGSQREENYDKLLNRMKELNMPIDEYEWYLDLRKYGSCNHAGFGLGFERAIMYLTGMQNIRDVIPFPRTPKNCEF